MTDPDSRAEFETWALDYYCSEIQERDRDSYTSHVLSDAWIGWQAARRTLPQGYAAGIEAAAKMCEELVGGPAVREAAIVPAHRIRTLPSPDAGVVEKWMGIESAPRDGTNILAIDEHGEQIVVCWERLLPKRGGWIFARTVSGEIATPHMSLTAWQPLPAPPALAALRTIGETE